MSERAGIAILAKAPIPGFAKTWLIPALGPEGAARLQRRLVEHTLATALACGLRPVTLWCAPDQRHPAFEAAGQRAGVRLRDQPEGDLGARMLRAFEEASPHPLIVIGTDSPVLRAEDLVASANALAGGADVVMSPAEDGGYGLIAASAPFAELFRDMPWSTDLVAAVTRARAKEIKLRLLECAPVWDVDTEIDYRRLVASGLLQGI